MFVTAQPKLKGLRTILVGVTLAMIVGGAALALRDAIRSAREQRDAAQRTLDAYAHFASYLFSTRVYLMARERTVLQAFVKLGPDDPWSGPLPPVTVIPAIPDTGEACAHLKSFPIYRFRLDLPSLALTVVGGTPSSEALHLIRDSIPKLAVSPPIASWHFGYLFLQSKIPEAIAYTPVRDSTGRVLAVYGYRSCYGTYDVWDYMLVHRVARIVPPFLTEGMPTDSILTLSVADAHGRPLYVAPARRGAVVATGTDTIPQLSDIIVKIGLRPRVANRLVVGGLPGSRLPDSFLVLVGSIVLAIATLAMLRREFRLVESREMFLANVSHELRTPLQHILLFVQILRLKRARTDAERDKAIEVIETETQRLIRLADNVLGVVRTSRPRVVVRAVDAAAIASRSAELCGPLAQARSMTIEVDAVPALAAADPESLQQILVNLIDNSVKYGPNGQTIWIGVRTDGNEVQIWVQDSGPGIAPKDRDRVWRPFVRLDTPGDATAGTGIGLTIVRELVDLMHGRAEIHDTAGGGVRLSIFLPRWTGGSE
ncbi:MAG: sensor histidine kinase [Gemmatimonadales bacterium]|jgi:signal transduction histidine kinase